MNGQRRFYANDGACFSRNPDASVLVEFVDDSPGPVDVLERPAIKSATIPASGWASVVSSMSAIGENADTWKAALDAQTGSK